MLSKTSSLHFIFVLISMGQYVFPQTQRTFVDKRDKQEFNWIKIGEQVWMAQNLNLAIVNSWCYDNDSSNCKIYGRLYEWGAAVNGSDGSNLSPSGVLGICPKGWHIPSKKEWMILEEHLGGWT